MMRTQASIESKSAHGRSFMQVASGLVQRKCACGSHTAAGGECDECAKKKSMLQRKLSIGASNDPLEQEADRVAGQVMAVSFNTQTKTVLPRIQRVTGQSREGSSTAPSSVDRVLADSGKPLDPVVRHDMELRFGYDFSQVRVHTGNEAEQSTQDVSARAYTVGNHVVFGVGQYLPRSNEGRRLIAHELTHVTQQQGGDRLTSMRVQRDVGWAQKGRNDPYGTSESLTFEDEEPLEAESKKETENKACTRTILSEGTCEFLAKNSSWTCCDPDNGIEDKTKTKSKGEPGKECASQKWTPLFTCDSTCKNAVVKGCDDNDNWMAIPKDQFERSKCDEVYTICANGKQTTGYVRDKSVTANSYEVSPGIQKALGVTVGASFKGAIYRPGAAQTKIDSDKCCK